MSDTIEDNLSASRKRPKATQNRKVAEIKLRGYLKSGFPILLLGNRGTGKTHWIKQFAENQPVGYFSCNKGLDSWDEKTGRWRGHRELVKIMETAAEADGGIFFLDDIDQLAIPLQKRLMYLLRGYKNKQLCIDVPTSKTVNCNIVFASNKPVDELWLDPNPHLKDDNFFTKPNAGNENHLIPEFYDFISQQVVELPSLRAERKERVSDWKSVWKNMNLGSTIPDYLEFYEWLTPLTLAGNFRDLEKIALRYHTFQTVFSKEEKTSLGYSNALDFVKDEYENYQKINSKTYFNFTDDKKTSKMLTEYKSLLYEWAIQRYKTKEGILEHFKELGERISLKTLYNWQNK
jgi:transcriptional regulator with AAA-type ATPase domain